MTGCSGGRPSGTWLPLGRPMVAETVVADLHFALLIVGAVLVGLWMSNLFLERAHAGSGRGEASPST